MADSGPAPVTPGLRPKDISKRLPLAPHTTLHVRATALGMSSMVFITTTDPSTSSTSSALGSLVYAMPNRFENPAAISTALQVGAGTIELAERVARILARRTGKPVYVGCSARFDDASMEEQLEGTKAIVAAAMVGLEGAVNGVAGGQTT